ncbi:MAG: aminodeoxychorismate/anthranilate synthase component II [Bifidobacteriaceae bacterium]|jgi:para-aminobenzoate synthetase component 2|nr:aminodeoxychorismate/anthranilate synthase component II [Bifidobacteriaceae bacterium]
MTTILVVDNYDSFAYTLVDYLRQLGAQVVVARNDQVPGAEQGQATQNYDGVLISPGPGAPSGAGATLAVIRECAERSVPMLGVCLGHQALGELFGARVVHAPQLRHGKTSQIMHDGRGVFTSLPNPLTATRYHSLAVVDPPSVLRVTAQADDAVIMGLAHQSLPLHGVQFHPESILSQYGHRLLANWLTLAGLPQALAAVPQDFASGIAV